MELKAGVYLITHRRTGRRYVGSAVDLQKRWKEHRRGLDGGKHHSRFLLRQWSKDGAEAFEFSVALYCDRENLLLYEQALIDFYRPEFNTAPTAGSQLGLKMRPESKAKMAEAARRTRNFTGHRHSEESKRRISETKTGRRLGSYSPDRVQRTAQAMKAARDAMPDSAVRIVRALHAAGLPHREVAQWVGRSYWAVADVVRGRTFSGVK